MATSIEWTATLQADGTITPGSTWNPVTGCSKVSPGCAHCYAETVALRFWPTQYRPRLVDSGKSLDTISTSHHEDYLANGLARPRRFTDVMCHEDRLDQPLRWKKPRRIFVNSMSDLFHEDVPGAFIDKVFAIMGLAHQHTFQVLTKRADRMRAYVNAGAYARIAGYIQTEMPDWYVKRPAVFPWRNLWLGVSVENQRFADERIPLLLQTPAAVRFISAEPLLGPVDLGLTSASCDCCPRFHSRWVRVERQVMADFPMCLLDEHRGNAIAPGVHRADSNKHGALSVNGLGLRIDEFESLPSLDWVIVGGESGRGARPFDLAWARSIVQQCRTASVPVFVKQLGRNVNLDAGGAFQWPLRDRKGGDPEEWPEDLRVREFPEVQP